MIIDIWLIMGIILFFIVLYELIKFIDNLIKKNEYIIWNIITLFLSLFLLLYAIYNHLVLHSSNLISLNNGLLMYYFLSIFVYIIIKLSSKIIRNLKINEKKFLDQNYKLEYETKHQNIRLKNKVNELEDTRSAMINILEDTNEQKDTIEKSKIDVDMLNKKLEKSNKELMKLDKLKDQFTSITAHELKTPLTSIKGFIQLLSDKKIFNDINKREKYFKIIIDDANRLSKLITDILDISRMDLGTLKFYLDTVNVKDFIDSVKKETSHITKEKNIKMIYEIDKNIPRNIMTDKNRLAQVLTNLINNAVNYSKEGNNAKIKICIKKNGEYILFSVKDNGIGISKNLQEHIFDKFYQVDSWQTRKIGGSGLGLAICKGLVNAIGGKIWVKSNVKKGAEFIFRLPIETSKNKKIEKFIKVFDSNHS